MDPLTQIMMQRQMAPDGTAGNPAAIPTDPKGVPPAVKRWITAEKMKNLYAGNQWLAPILESINSNKPKSKE